MDALKVLSELSKILLSDNNIEKKLSYFIEKFADQIKAAHGLIYFFDNDVLHESNKADIEFDIEEFKKLVSKKDGLLIDDIKKAGLISSSNSDKLKTEIRNYFSKRKVVSYMLFPLCNNLDPCGYLLIEDLENKWGKTEIELIKDSLQIVSSAYFCETKKARNENDFLTLFDNINDLLIVTDKKGKFIHANKSFFSVLGFEAEDLKDFSIMDMQIEDEGRSSEQVFKSLLKNDDIKRPLKISRKDGFVFPVETRLWSGRWKNEECFFVLMKDLSAENEALLKFAKLFENNPALMAVIELPDIIYIDVNSAFLNKLGYRSDEVLGHSGYDLKIFNEKDRGKTREIITEFRKVNEQEVTLKCKDGTFLDGLFSAEIIESRGKSYLLMVIVDVTDIHKKEQELERFFMVNLDLLCIADLSGKLIKVNKEWEYTFGYTIEELTGSNALELLHPDDVKMTVDAIENQKEKDKILNFINRNRRKDGSYRYIEWRSQRFDEYGYASGRDVTERIAYEKELELREERLKNIIEGTNIGTWEWNIQTGEVILNERMADIIGYSFEELQHVSIDFWRKYVHPDDLEKFNKLLKDHFTGKLEYFESEVRMKHKNGNYVWVLDRGKVIKRDKEGKPLMMFGTHADITEKKCFEERLKEIAVTDPLTGIYNRRYFVSRLNDLYNYYKRDKITFSIAMIDIDFFKKLNDTYGHPAGDKVLVEFSNILSSNIRTYDLLARYGGEEFIILLIGMNRTEAEIKLNNILGIVRKSVFDYENSKIVFTFSCGISEASEICSNDESVDCLIKTADQRLYLAKRNGRNRIIINFRE